MNRIKKIMIAGVVMLTIGVTSVTAFAASDYKTPAELVAGLTGKTVESVMTERQETSKTCGTIAAEAGKLDEFKKENMDMKKENLKQQVAEKKMTQEKANSVIEAMENNQEKCDGSGTAKIGQKEGASFGSNGLGQGKSNGKDVEGQTRGKDKMGPNGEIKGDQGRRRLKDGSCNTINQ